MAKRLIDYLPVFTIVTFYFAYCNLHGYFKEFKVDIYNYISNTEIVLSFLPFFVFITSISGVIAIQLAISDIPRDVLDLPEDKSVSKREASILRQILTEPAIVFFVLVSIHFLIDLIMEFVFKIRAFRLAKFDLVYVIVSILITLYFIAKRKKRTVLSEYPFIAAIAIVIYLGYQLMIYQKLEAEKIKVIGGDKKISFVVNKRKVETGDNLVLIGETQSTIFLYSKFDSTTLIFNRSMIDSMVIK